jgi:hypothetical protein
VRQWISTQNRVKSRTIPDRIDRGLSHDHHDRDGIVTIDGVPIGSLCGGIARGAQYGATFVVTCWSIRQQAALT